MYAATRKGSRKQQAKQIASAKALDPADTDSLGRLPTATLEEVAREDLEIIRRKLMKVVVWHRHIHVTAGSGSVNFLGIAR